MNKTPADRAAEEARQAESEARRARLHAEHTATRAAHMKANEDWLNETRTHRAKVEELLTSIASSLTEVNERGRRRAR